MSRPSGPEDRNQRTNQPDPDVITTSYRPSRPYPMWGTLSITSGDGLAGYLSFLLVLSTLIATWHTGLP